MYFDFTKKYYLRFLILFTVLTLVCSTRSALGQPNSNPQIESSKATPANDIELGEEYVEYANHKGKKSPKRSNNSSNKSNNKKPNDKSLATAIAMYIPNRLLDLVDIVRADVGVGPSFGAVARITKYGQVGYRTFSPISLRVGPRGRKLPVFVERSSEIGVGPAFLQSHDREVTDAEVGLGADLILVGAYAGISFDELVDFIAGFACIDIKSDDL